MGAPLPTVGAMADGAGEVKQRRGLTPSSAPICHGECDHGMARRHAPQGARGESDGRRGTTNVDALMAALVLGAICQAGDKTPWLAAILADRFRSPALVIDAAAVALAGNYALGFVAALWIAPLLTPEARQLLLALALVLAGLSTTLRSRSPDRLSGWRLGAVATSVLGLAIMIVGDRMQFIVLGLAARSELPWLAAVGGTLGALSVVAPAAVIGERRWLALPQPAIRIASALVLVVTGVIAGLNAVRLL